MNGVRIIDMPRFCHPATGWDMGPVLSSNPNPGTAFSASCYDGLLEEIRAGKITLGRTRDFIGTVFDQLLEFRA